MSGGKTALIIDSTLRDGLQTPGVELALSDRLKIAEAIAMAGVNEIEAGIPAASELDSKAVTAICSMGLPCRISAWCRATREDIDAAAKAKAQAVHISLPASDILLDAFSKTRNWALEAVEELLPYARNSSGYLSIGFQDAARADYQFLLRISKAAQSAGAQRLRFADSCGIWNPFNAFDLFRRLSEELPEMPLGIHSHNDLGMATANALGAILGGASIADTTVNGLGERTGNPPLAELAMALDLQGVRTTIKTDRLLPLSKLVAKLAKRAIPADKPVVGAASFLHHSGLHVRALLKNPMAYQPYLPSKIGRHEAFGVFIGPQSGRASVSYALDKLGMPSSQDSIEKALNDVKDKTAGSISGRIFKHE